MIKKYSKLFLLVASSITFILGIIVGKPLEHAVIKYLEKKNISYELTHSYFESIRDAQKYVETEGLTSFDLNLDDPLINKYHIVKIKLINEGIYIRDTLKFNITIDNQLVKIIDIKHRVNVPENKNLSITDTIPALSWSFDELNKYDSLYALSWQAPQQRTDGSKVTGIAGYNIYGSAIKDVGYGQINEKLAKESSWRIENNRYPFYKTEAVDLQGRRSELSLAMPFPEIFAFAPFFKDVVLIEPNVKPDIKTSCNNCQIYDSLTHAIEKEGAQATFLINRKKSDVLSSDNLVDSNYYKTNVLYSDDLRNLIGKADIFLPAGLDEDSEIFFYILYKIWPETEHDINFNIIGNPAVHFVKINDISNRIVSNNSKFAESGIQEKNKKTMLTPPVVSTYLANNKIYLLWDYPKDFSYKGVRIFRSVKSNAKILGDEVYDGLGETDKLKCITDTSVDDIQNTSAISAKNYITGDPPPRVKPSSLEKKSSIDETSPPLPPSISMNIVISLVANINEKDSKPLPYFVDTEVSPELTYTYTLYAYDEEDNYSYPININASLKEYSKNRSCKSMKSGL